MQEKEESSELENFQAETGSKRFVPRYDYNDAPKKPEKPKLRLSYEHIAHMHNKDFERAIFRNDFVEKYSPYYNILQFLHVFRSQQGLSAYDPLPEEKLNIYIADKTPFDNWREFLVAAYENQATTDEIDALLDRDYHAA
jgi:hypothetical protein